MINYSLFRGLILRSDLGIRLLQINEAQIGLSFIKNLHGNASLANMTSPDPDLKLTQSQGSPTGKGTTEKKN